MNHGARLAIALIVAGSVAVPLAAEPGEKLYEGLAPTPFGNEIIEAFAERAIQAEQLGHHDVTDLLAYRSQAFRAQPDPGRISMQKPAIVHQTQLLPASDQIHRPFLGKSALLLGLAGRVARFTQPGQHDLHLVQSDGILLADP